MPQKSPIEWTDYTSNPIYAINRETGERGWFCEKVSPGCGHCYSCQINKARLGNGLDFVASNADKVDFVLNEKELVAIIKLNNRLAKKGERAKLFPFDMTDLFYEGHPDEFLDKFLAVVAICQNIDFQVLTKRVERLHRYMSEWNDGEPDHVYVDENGGFGVGKGDRVFSNGVYADWPLPNLWLGVSVENQEFADKRIPYLLQTPAAVRFLSCEPLLGPVNLEEGWRYGGCSACGYTGYIETDTAAGVVQCACCVSNGRDRTFAKLDWVITGGESGPNARPCDVAWIRSIVNQCKSASVPVFVKQLGARPSATDLTHTTGSPTLLTGGDGYRLNLRDKKGGDISEWHASLRVREFPETSLSSAATSIKNAAMA